MNIQVNIKREWKHVAQFCQTARATAAELHYIPKMTVGSDWVLRYGTLRQQ